jgi:hypothetical protein
MRRRRDKDYFKWGFPLGIGEDGQPNVVGYIELRGRDDKLQKTGDSSPPGSDNRADFLPPN